MTILNLIHYERHLRDHSHKPSMFNVNVVAEALKSQNIIATIEDESAIPETSSAGPHTATDVLPSYKPPSLPQGLVLLDVGFR